MGVSCASCKYSFTLKINCKRLNDARSIKERNSWAYLDSLRRLGFNKLPNAHLGQSDECEYGSLLRIGSRCCPRFPRNGIKLITKCREENAKKQQIKHFYPLILIRTSSSFLFFSSCAFTHSQPPCGTSDSSSCSMSIRHCE